MTIRRFAPFVLLAALAACNRDQSVFAPRGPAAKSLANLGGSVLIAFIAVAVIMFGLLLAIAFRRRGTLAEHEPADTGGGQSWVIVGGFAIPTLILAVIFIATLRVMAAFPLRHHSSETDTLSHHPPDIIVTGHQWWWQAEYVGEAICQPGSDGKGVTLGARVMTANELHIPIGLPVDIELRSADVIHSFWVPQLHGKVDLVPGEANRIRIVASQPGRYRGECAEYCGEQHAHMALFITADQPEDFQKWILAQRAQAAMPVDDQQRRGRELFESHACVLCHTVRGTPANGKIGPDLTHIASRQTIASGVLPNNAAYLSAWVTHAQSLKPGAEMPDLTVFDGDDLHVLVAYLQHLR